MSAEQAGGSYRPRLVLRFGITGHRPPRLLHTEHDRVRAQCRKLFELAQGALGQIALAHPSIFSADPPEARLISSLAEGADVLAAEAALESGVPLSACLPFPAEVYRKDFGDEEWARTEELIGRSVSVMQLSEYRNGDEAAYEMAGRLVLSQSDIMIAIWDGEAARGRGGTTQVIAEAVALHQPVIHIDATGETEPELLWSGLHDVVPDRPSLDGVERRPAYAALPHLIRALCAPPEGEDERQLLEFVEHDPSPHHRSYGWPLLLALTGARPWYKISIHPPEVDGSVAQMQPHTEPFESEGRFGQVLNSLLLERFGRADAEGGYFALRFRSSFVTNFAMAGVAVLLALSGLLFPEAKKFLIAGELLVISLIIANTHGANRLNLHQRWLDSRHLAERLRLLAMSGTIGQLNLREVEDGTKQPGWVSWLARATARELGLTFATFDQAYLAKVRDTMLALIDEQVGYHRSNAHAMHVANHRLHKLGDLLFIGTIIACLFYLGKSLVSPESAELMGFSITGIVTFITALFPALAAALYGIRMQGDFAATSERSTVIARQLGQLRSAIERDPLSLERLIERSRRLGEIMLSEVHQWRLHYETRPLSLPG
ncbi:hypothetical protein P7228_04540 [Altererythrobacter arenosus]|uniref:SMODS and SLOG-associating 2TM effector domain-containing protein n=1 Tax=Altererythrobacter arenosus TaxID=3032592 RepID=A0ABY8FUB6_9SPHN|nr:hypothetical protein [Altererythrobacter sp. CAU 1644]WFL78337.1 hypothetical protein P7228_04540 [Altererythrobacter sp. CAU 1644]